MRKSLAALGLVGVLAATPALAAASPPAAPGSPPKPAVTPPPPDPALVYYPAAARAAGVEGSAILKCARNQHLTVKNCVLVSETPAGQGFGAAAMAMAALSPDNPKLDFPDEPAKPPEQVEVQFTLRPPEIHPDLTSMTHTLLKPAIVTAPSNAQIQAAYPERALADQVEGRAAMDCVVLASGKLSRCQVAGELPAGYGFGQATLDLAGDFVMKARQVDGAPVDGAMVRVGVSFSSSDPAAPLSLGLKPKS
jgi:hypothetical protein